MRARWPLLATVVTASLVYLAYPYVTLYRLGTAVQTADARTLEKLVDWHSVREGIKEDIADLVIDSGPAAPGKLPAFGAGFVRGIASTAIDKAVTPQAIAAASTTPRAASSPATAMSGVRVNWAFFESPTSFTVELQPQALQDPIRMQLDLRGASWQVRRVWLPEAMLKGQPART
ncbi:MAG: DUF2939 domain-containing protein [Proteobacteria bacterium]|nr:DUF2939 domain-containing protein [Pseudomonadota bacterium]